jgi:hypothetical protein
VIGLLRPTLASSPGDAPAVADNDPTGQYAELTEDDIAARLTERLVALGDLGA